MPLDARPTECETSPPGVIPVCSGSFGSWHVAIGRRAFAAAELEGHYDRTSGVWQAKIERLGFGEAYRSLIRKVLQQNRDPRDLPDLRVLDAGIGTGAMAAAFAAHRRRNFQLVGLDLSSEMLRRARERLQAPHIRLALHQADLRAIPYPDCTFDVVLASHVLEHLADPEAGLAELFRVLKPGGLLIACVTRRSPAGSWIQFLWRTHQVDMRSAARWLRRSGFADVRAVPLERCSRARQFSIGYVGRKPVCRPRGS